MAYPYDGRFIVECFHARRYAHIDDRNNLPIAATEYLLSHDRKDHTSNVAHRGQDDGGDLHRDADAGFVCGERHRAGVDPADEHCRV